MCSRVSRASRNIWPFSGTNACGTCAACNLNGPSGFPGNVTVLGISSTSPNLRTFNDGQ